MTLANNLINHVVFVLDESGSMAHLRDSVVKVFDAQVSHLAEASKRHGQETRVSIYTFSSDVKCIVYDKDVMRLPSIKGAYHPGGGTRLIDATLMSLEDLEKTAQLYGDHAFLVYVITDGQENESRHSAQALTSKLKAFKENWTFSTLVPDQTGVHYAKQFGFPPNNIQVWATDAKGVEEFGRVIQKSTEYYMQQRSVGNRGTKNLFNIDTKNLNSSAIKNSLEELKPGKDYDVYLVRKDDVIKPFVESWSKEPYRVGSAYYQLSKKEAIQASKQVAVMEVRTGKVYTGAMARSLINLPNHEVKVAPADIPNYKLFIQSTSTNRKLVKDTSVIVMK